MAAVASRSMRRLLSSRCTTHNLTPKARCARSTPAFRTFCASSRTFEKKFTEDHEWVEVEADGQTGTIGISEYAANALGDVVFVELPALDLEVNKGESIGAVESVKSASDIMSPVSGRISEANTILEEKPGVINQSPEKDGWLARIVLSNPKEVEELMDAEGYKKFTEEADSH